MTPEQLAQERQQLIGHLDALVDTYSAGEHSVDNLITLRRDLAVTLYRVAAHIKQVHGEAGLSYVTRKFVVAKAILDARRLDADPKKPTPMNVLETRVLEIDDVKKAHTDEVWKDAAREELRSKVDGAKQVLAALQQEIAFLTYEYKNTHQQA